jgi:hypothetical protein
MGRHNDSNVYEDLIGKSVPDHLNPRLKGAWQISLQTVVIRRDQYPQDARVEHNKRCRSQAPEQDITNTTVGRIKILPDKKKNGRGPKS